MPTDRPLLRLDPTPTLPAPASERNGHRVFPDRFPSAFPLLRRTAPGIQPFDEFAEATSLILPWLGDASIIVIGGSSEGTAEFYELRAQLTRELIAAGGVRAIVTEGDWVDACQVNRHISPGNTTAGEETALVQRLNAYPSWTWQNQPMVDFLAWLRRHNATAKGASDSVGFYGLDRHNWHNSIQSLLGNPERSPESATHARMESLGCNLEGNAWPDQCPPSARFRQQIISELTTVEQRLQSHVGDADSELARMAVLSTQQSERFYRKLLGSRVECRNTRCQHQADTLDTLHRLWSDPSSEQPAKVIVWAHNCQVGDGRYTELGLRGEVTLGQILRQRYGSAVRLLGMTTFRGELLATPIWRGAAHTTPLVPAIHESFESTFHQFEVPRFFWPFLRSAPRPPALVLPRAERSIGTVYHPDSDRAKNYYSADISGQFDAIVHLDQTHALVPLTRPTASTRIPFPTIRHGVTKHKL